LSANAAKSTEGWPTAKLVSVGAQKGETTTSSTTNGTVDKNGNVNANTTDTSIGYVDYTVVIDDGKMLYYGAWRLVFRWEHDPQFTENEMVKYSLNGKKLTVVDDTGKQIKMKLLKKRIKE
jgi:hypothetical protein